MAGGISYSGDGDVSSALGEGDYWLVKLNSHGELIWEKSYGGKGNDTYLFGRDFGSDTVYDYDMTAGNADILSFGANITPDQLWFTHQKDDLVVQIIGTSDKVTVNNWYKGADYQVEKFFGPNGNFHN